MQRVVHRDTHVDAADFIASLGLTMAHYDELVELDRCVPSWRITPSPAMPPTRPPPPPPPNVTPL